jgi:CBS domain-containing protein
MLGFSEAGSASGTSGTPMIEDNPLFRIAQEIQQGASPPPVGVRDFLSWFGVKRRGYVIVEKIRKALSEARIETDPDFESAYLDSSLALRIKAPSDTRIEPPSGSLSLTGHAVGISSATASLTVVTSDPTYRISKLKAANTPPVSVKPDASVTEATTLMLTNNFSQLPVMTNERDVKGLISWTSIGTRLSLGQRGELVRELMDTATQEILNDASIFQAIDIVAQNQYVLVRAPDRRIVGIVTATDLSVQFQQLSEPFLLLGEIENHIRRMIGTRFSKEELASQRDPADSRTPPDTVNDLTLGEYVWLLSNDERWNRLSLQIDRRTFCAQLDRIRTIRNEVMHFDPDGIDAEDLDHLRDFVRFLRRLHSLGVPS